MCKPIPDSRGLIEVGTVLGLVTIVCCTLSGCSTSADLSLATATTPQGSSDTTVASAANVLSTAPATAKANPTSVPTAMAVSTQTVPVQAVPVKQEALQRTTTQPASVEAFYRAEIRARVSGYVREVPVEMGDHVQLGATLLVVDVPDLENQLAIANAQLTRHQAAQQQAEAAIQVALAQITAAEAKLAQTQSERVRVDANLAALEAEFKRISDLVQRQAVESRLLDEVRKRRDAEQAAQLAMQSAIQAADADLTVMQARHNFAIAESAAAAAQTEIATRERQQAEITLGFATLKAPFAGIITARYVDPGDLVIPGRSTDDRQPLLVLSQSDKVRIQIPLPEADAAHVRPGDPVRLTFRNFPGESALTAPVTRLANELDPHSRTMLAEVELANPNHKLLPGMFGQATIELAQKVATNTLPARAVRFEESGKAYVYLVDDTQTVSIVPVTTGLDLGHTLEITSGVTAGQWVIDRHLQRFTPGQKVRLLE